MFISHSSWSEEITVDDAFTKSLLKYTPTDVFEALFKLKSGLNVTSNLTVLDALFNCFTERI